MISADERPEDSALGWKAPIDHIRCRGEELDQGKKRQGQADHHRCHTQPPQTGDRSEAVADDEKDGRMKANLQVLREFVVGKTGDFGKLMATYPLPLPPSKDPAPAPPPGAAPPAPEPAKN